MLCYFFAFLSIFIVARREPSCIKVLVDDPSKLGPPCRVTRFSSSFWLRLIPYGHGCPQRGGVVRLSEPSAVHQAVRARVGCLECLLRTAAVASGPPCLVDPLLFGSVLQSTCKALNRRTEGEPGDAENSCSHHAEDSCFSRRRDIAREPAADDMKPFLLGQSKSGIMLCIPGQA